MWELTPPEAGAHARPHVEGVNVLFSNQSGIFWRLGQANWSHLKYFFKSSSTSVVRENAAMHRFAVKLQNFFVGDKTSADFFGRVCKDN